VSAVALAFWVVLPEGITGFQQSALDGHSNPVTELPFFVEMIARNR
jgi:hypothetical protein